MNYTAEDVRKIYEQTKDTPKPVYEINRTAKPFYNQQTKAGEFANALGQAAKGGITGFNSSLFGAVKAVDDWTAENLFGGQRNNLLQPIYNHYIKENENQQQIVQQEIEKKNLNPIVNDLTQSTVGMLPSIGVGLMSGGASLGAQAGVSAAAAAPTMLQTTKTAAKTVTQNPQFWTSMVHTFGGAYNEAAEAGADTNSAIRAALLQAVPESLIEVSGGTEKLVERLAVKTGGAGGKLLQSAFEEGMEEIFQYPFEGMAKKSTYAPETPLFSVEKQAVINPFQQSYAGAVGAVGGLLAGGGAKAINGGIDWAADLSQKKKPSTAPKVFLPQADTPETVSGSDFYDTTLSQGNGGADKNHLQNSVEEVPAGYHNSKHTPKMQKTIDEYNNSVDEGLIEFAKYAKENPESRWANYTMSDVGNREVEDLKQLTGIDTTGFRHNIKPSAIVHIENRHGAKGAADSSMANIEDLARIDYVMNNYDLAQKANRTSTAFRNRDGSAAQLVEFKKAINGTYYVIEAVPDSKAKMLQVVSAYIQKKKTEPVQMPDVKFPQLTSENEVAYPDSVSNPNLAQNLNGVNGQYMQNDTPHTPFGSNTVGSAEASPRPTLAQLNEQYGTLRKGEQPRAREVDLPRRTSEGNISRFAQNAAESAAVDDTAKSGIEREIEAGTFAYVPISDLKALRAANERLGASGPEAAQAEFDALFASGRRMNKNDIVMGERLIQEAVKRKDYETASRMIADVAALGSDLGQQVQAMRVLKRLTPEGNLMALRRAVDRTKAILTHKDKPLLKFAREDYKEVCDILAGNGKMNPSDTIRDNRTIFKNRPLEWLRKTNSGLMEWGDGWFLKYHYVRSLAQYIKANNIAVAESNRQQARRRRVQTGCRWHPVSAAGRFPRQGDS